MHILIHASESVLLHPPLVVIQFGVASRYANFFLGPTRQDIARLDKPDRAHYVALMLDPKIIDDLREEFDIQQAVLARARENLEFLEARISALEAAARKRPG